MSRETLFKGSVAASPGEDPAAPIWTKSNRRKAICRRGREKPVPAWGGGAAVRSTTAAAPSPSRWPVASDEATGGGTLCGTDAAPACGPFVDERAGAEDD